MLFPTNYILSSETIFQWEDRKSPIAELNYATQTPTGRAEMRRQHMQGELLEMVYPGVLHRRGGGRHLPCRTERDHCVLTRV